MAKKERREQKLHWLSLSLTAVVVAFCVLSSIQAKTGRNFGLPEFSLPRMGEFAQTAASTADDADLSIYFLDVGQAKCILIKAPEKTVLIDAGDNGTANATAQKIKSLGGETIDLAIGTHPHADHIGGMDTVINTLDVREILLPELPDELVPTTATYRDMLEAIDKQDVPVTPAEPGLQYDLGGGVILTILAPIGVHDDLNDMSVVSRLDYGEKSFLFTGDASKASEADMLDAGARLDANLLDVGHHGSGTATTAAFLRMVNPSVAVISCGADNSYGHPHRDVVERLENRGIAIFRTDLQGMITVRSDGKSVTVETERE